MATYYIDPVNGDDSNDGSVSNPWLTLDRAYPYVVSCDGGNGWFSGRFHGYTPEVIAGDTVVLLDGNYGYIKWNSIVNTGWITYQAGTNQTSVVFKSLYLQSGPAYNAHVKFSGVRFVPTSYGDVHADNGKFVVYLESARYVEFDGCYIKGRGTEDWWGCGLGIVNGGGDVSHHITVKNTTIYDTENAVVLDNVNHHLVFDDVIIDTTGDNGISGAGLCDSSFANVTISGTFTYFYGTLLDGNDTVIGTFLPGDLLVQDNTGMRGLVADTPSGYYNDPENRIGDGTTWGPYTYRDGHLALYLASRTDSNGGPLDDYDGFDEINIVRAYRGGTLTGASLTPSYAFNAPPHHLDLVQLYQSPGTPSPQNDVLCDGLTFSKCRFVGSSEGQGVFLKGQSNLLVEDCVFCGDTLAYPLEISNASLSGTIRNNTIYTTNLYNAPLEMVGNPDGTFYVYNNIIAGGFTLYDSSDPVNDSGNVVVKNNIVGVPKGTWGDISFDSTNYSYGHQVLTAPELAALFTDPDNNDFALKAGSMAIGFGDADYASGTDILGITRANPPSAGAYEYVGPADGYVIPEPSNTWSAFTNYVLAQVFTASHGYNAASVKLLVSTVGGAAGTATVELKAVDVNGFPTGSALAMGTFDGSELTTSSEWREIVFSAPYTVVQGTKYAICLSCPGSDIRWWSNDTDVPGYSGGNFCMYYSGSWHLGASGVGDLLFEVWPAGDTPTTVEVPDVMGMTQAEAESVIETIGLTVGNVTTEHSDTVAEGDVISQDPVATTEVSLGSSVDLVVSLGVDTRVAMPDVVGDTQAAATTTIEALGLTVAVDEQYNNTVADGVVIYSTPVADTLVAAASEVGIAVSLGKPAVPDVVGLSAAAADAAITGVAYGAALTSELVYAHSDAIAEGLVISQDPVASTEVNIGSSVELTVSLGSPIVPDVAGMTQAAAEAAIEAEELILGDVTTAYSTTVAAGLVISQDPAADAVAEIGDPVDLVLSLGAKTYKPPGENTRSTLVAAGNNRIYYET